MTLYRIVQIEEELFEVQFKRELVFPFMSSVSGWQRLNTHGTLHSAKRCMNHMLNNEFPKVVVNAKRAR